MRGQIGARVNRMQTTQNVLDRVSVNDSVLSQDEDVDLSPIVNLTGAGRLSCSPRVIRLFPVIDGFYINDLPTDILLTSPLRQLSHRRIAGYENNGEQKFNHYV